MSIGYRTSPLDPPGTPVAGPLGVWAAERDAVLRGLVHALSNRAGTVIALAGMLGAEDGAALAGRVLGGEAERLEALVAQFRLATDAPFDAPPEPVVVAEAVGEAVVLHAHAAEGRDVAVTVAAAPDAAVLAARAGLVHALLVLLGAAKRESERHAAAGGVTLRAVVEGDVVALRTDPVASGGAVAAAAWLLGSAGARATDGVLLVPRFGSGCD